MTDWLPGDHVMWFVIEAVDRLDTAAFHLKARLGGVGREGYDPDMLLTLFVYAMAHEVRSSRRIEKLCATDLAFKVICAGDIPDHTVLARFRQRHEKALEDLLTEVLVLCAQLGMIRLGVVALDGTKIAANASRYANRTGDGLRKLAAKHLAETAAADAAEDALFGAYARGDELPEKLRDRTGRGRRISQALDVIAERKATPRKGSQAAANAYQKRVTDPDAPMPGGQPPAKADPVMVAKAKWERERVRAQRRVDDYQARVAAAAAEGRRKPRGSAPLPPEETIKVRRRRADYEAAQAAAQAEPGGEPGKGAGPAGSEPDPKPQSESTSAAKGKRGRDKEPIANVTDPESRLLKSRNGWVQGYNGQTAVSDDGFIMTARSTQDTNDLGQFKPTANAVEAAAANLADRTGRDDLTVGVIIGDSGYDSDDNLDTSNGGPDRLIANATGHDMATHAKNDPATGDPPTDATPRQCMDHRLRTPDGQALYKRRAPIVEAPNAWLKDRRGLRKGFARRGQPAATSELAFAAAVTNLVHLFHMGTTTADLATT